MANILVIGGVTVDDLVYVDRLPEPRPQTFFSKRFHTAVGGTGAGKALNLNRLGHTVTLHALIGDDERGQIVRDLFAQEGLSFAAEIDPAGTEHHINIMADGGDRLSIYAVYATFEPAIDMDQLESLIVAADVVALNIINYCRHAIPLCKKHNKPIWCDIHDFDGKNPYHQDFVRGADVLFMSSDALPDYRAFMQVEMAAGKQFVVCTHGKAGATALDAQGWIDAPPVLVEAVDTNGAGDSFFSGVLHGHMAGLPLKDALHYGALTAMLCVQSPDLFGHDLSPTTLEALYRQHFGGGAEQLSKPDKIERSTRR